MTMREKVRQLCQDCAGHSPREYALLAVLLAAGLATVVFTYVSANSGALITAASHLG